MRTYISVIFSLVCFSIFGQNQVRGTVMDAESGLPLIGATIICGANGTVTDTDGAFTLEAGVPCQLKVSYVGYAEKKIDAFTGGEIRLHPLAESLDVMIVTGSKYERKLSESTVSVDVIKPALLKSINTSKANEILDKLPGVQVVGGQANIRGGSGFSYGAGSRVMVLIDDMPALQVDAGFANWGDMPIEMLDQIEVLKGAASSLYGSAALNGIVNFRRKKVGNRPTTEIFTAYTQYLNPAVPIYKWWDDTRYRANIGVSHTHRLGKVDLSAHGFYSKLESFNKETYDNRGRLGLNMKYRISDRLAVGFNTLANFLDNSDFFLWHNDLRGIYTPFPGTISKGQRTRIIVDPYAQYFDRSGNKHKVQLRYFHTNNRNNNNQSNKSNTWFSEYQIQREIEALDLTLTGGGVYALTRTDSELFGDTIFDYTNYAVYLQVEKKFGPISVSAGSRYENNIQTSPDEFAGVPVPNGQISEDALVNRLGVNYTLGKATSIRASWGQGYRFPTVTERFITTTFGGFNIFPNPLLTPEKGWTAEVGIKQGVKIGNMLGFADLSFFTSEYIDMIEFSFLTDPLGFTPINVGDTKINGYEIGFGGQGHLGEVKTSIITGYTYIDPFYRNYDTRQEIRDNLSTDQNILKYRSKHSFKFDVESVWRRIKLGVSFQYYSHMINIDKRLETPFDGVDFLKIKAFRDRNNRGFSVIDLRTGVEFGKFSVSFILANVLNKAYTIRPGLLEAPRNITLRADYSF